MLHFRTDTRTAKRRLNRQLTAFLTIIRAKRQSTIQDRHIQVRVVPPNDYPRSSECIRNFQWGAVTILGLGGLKLKGGMSALADKRTLQQNGASTA